MGHHSPTHAGRREAGPEIPWPALGLMLYLLIAAGLAHILAPEALSPASTSFFVLLGAVGFWRYGWAAIHLGRAFLYLRVRFPALRAAADLGAGPPPPLFILVTAYRQEPVLLVRMFRSVIAEARSSGAATTIIAAVTDAAERALLDGLVRRLDPPANLRLVLMEQDGSGKRSALAEGLRAIARRAPGPDALLILMDGDTLLPVGCLRRIFPFFRCDLNLAAVTTDARAEMQGSAWARDWYRLRYVQRHLLMSSLSLSRRLLVLTGRFSVFRARLAIEPGFVAAVEADSLSHWRYGTVRFLTGDDKSTWYWLLRHDRAMLYLPDVQVVSVEEIPPGRFLDESIDRMRRWYGNMLRNNGRALALGPRRMPPFLWWCLADQRVSMWTSLSGPVLALTAAAFGKVAALPAYLLWVMVSRLAYAAGLSLATGGFSMRWPMLLFYNQMVGAIVKVVTGYGLDRQEWSRQGVTAPAVTTGRIFWNSYLAVLAAGLFVYVGATASAGLQIPDRLVLAAVFGGAGAAATPTIDGLQARPEDALAIERPLMIRRVGNTVSLCGGIQ